MWIVLIVVYIAFIGLGMADSLLGPAWPAMNLEYAVPVSYAGIASFIFSAGKVLGCLNSDRLSRKYGEAVVTGASTALLAVGLLGIALFHSFYLMVVFCIPFGLGCGFLDVTVNSYVAVHYESRYNSWLHCLWGIGAAIGPVMLGFFMAKRGGWSFGFLSAAIYVMCSCIAVFVSAKLWKRHMEVEVDGQTQKFIAEHLPLPEVLKLPGVVAVLLFSFFYEGIQDAAMLWSGSFMVNKGINTEMAATYVSFLFVGITVSRFINGFLTMKFSDRALIRMGSVLMALGLVLFTVADGMACVAGLFSLGIGMAPVVPCIMHHTAQKSDPRYAPAIVNIQMAAFFAGATIIPPFFGLITKFTGVGFLGIYLIVLLVLMIFLQEKGVK